VEKKRRKTGRQIGKQDEEHTYIYMCLCEIERVGRKDERKGNVPKGVDANSTHHTDCSTHYEYAELDLGEGGREEGRRRKEDERRKKIDERRRIKEGRKEDEQRKTKEGRRKKEDDR
jgi:hypothetical protein